MNDNINVADDGYNWPYHGSKLIPKEDLKPFLKRDNISGLKHLFLHLSLIAISGILIYLSPSIYLTIPVMFIHGTFIAFLYAGLHECIHKTAFKNRKLNEFIGYFLGFILLRSFLNGRYRHIAHHTYTQHPEKDPDKVDFPKSYTEYFKHVTSFAIWIRIVDLLNTCWKIEQIKSDYIPESDIRLLFRESSYWCWIYTFMLSFNTEPLFSNLLMLPRIMGR